MTTGSRPAPFRVAVGFKGKDELIILDQIRALDKTRLVKRMGRVDRGALGKVLRVMGEMFGE